MFIFGKVLIPFYIGFIKSWVSGGRSSPSFEPEASSRFQGQARMSPSILKLLSSLILPWAKFKLVILELSKLESTSHIFQNQAS